MGHTTLYYKFNHRGVDSVTVDMMKNDKNVDFKFSKVIVHMDLNDLERIKEILLNKKATPDNIRKLEKIDEVINKKREMKTQMERVLNDC